MNLIDIIEQNTLWPLTGGIHPAEMKHLSNQTTIARLPLAKTFYIPLPQVGDSALLVVKVGDRVLKGQPLTKSAGAMYLAAHAPTSGLITAITPHASNHPSALPELTCIIEADGKDESVPYHSAAAQELSKEELIARIREAGIAGMGGAMFPSHIKLRPAAKIELLIINGVECEPYISSDDRLMREHAANIVAGIEIIQQLIGARRIVIAIEDNKAEAAAAMTSAIAQSAALKPIALVRVIPTKYPSGGEKQLIQIITGKEVPSGSIPAQLGIVVHNVGTAYAIRDAVVEGKPLIERVVTVTGGNIEQNGNYWLPIGTPVSHVLQQLKLRKDKQAQVIVGGPMMGYALPDANVPVLKGTNCLLIPKRNELTHASAERACIRCGECAQVCPASLLPQQLYWHAKAEEYDKANAFNLQDCIECGCCAFVCPSEIPLVKYYRVAKAAIRKDRAEKVQAEQAKIRFEARIARLEQEKQEREAKAKEAAERRKAAMNNDDKDAVAAALARVQAKKQAQATTAPSNDAIAAAVARAKAKKQQAISATDTATDDKKSQVAAAIARAKAKKAQASASDTSAASASTLDTPAQDSKQAQIAAAVARAKAKKAAQTAPAQNNEVADKLATDGVEQINSTNDKAARVAAAVARAKAKKTAATESSVESAEAPSTDQKAQVAAPDDKAARVAAAVARAKAKKAAQTDEQAASETTLTEAPATQEKADEKQAKIAAAIAKAKAKKAVLSGSDDAEQTEAMSKQADDNSESSSVSAADAKKARIAAAVAKAKAKKAAEQDNQENQS
ncbi:electron transporter RnfC [Shewanella mangrovi]|uniref:Ion-translocating oxidoreductase complex subunit C n=1 Tax=Shewanella mangrovi TaxID=1515746 RepID=A0A094J9D4_9GAMM|nr:electron transport complex subunit RsxC [Shewanella mangrovi]KFZ36525.1 electron transporter RnfC [Shewanella mangrovi]